jgi:xylulokinase
MSLEHSFVTCIPRAGLHLIVWLPSSLLVARLGTSILLALTYISLIIPYSLDDKLFSFWLLQGDAHPFQHTKGIYRFETGVKVQEFRDLRANPRCLVESQVLSFRVRWARMVGTGVLGASFGRAKNAGVRAPAPSNAGVLSSLGLPFDAYDPNPLPSRVLVTGAAANFPAVSNLVGDVFAAPVFMPSTQVDSAQVGSPHRNAPAKGFPARAALGSAYIARWVWGRERGAAAGSSGGRAGYEDEIRRLLGKRWLASSGAPAKTNVAGAPPTAIATPGSAPGSGASTPYGRRGAGLGASPLVEEEEEEEDAGTQGAVAAAQATSRFPLGGFAEGDMLGRSRTLTSSTMGSSTSFGSGSTAYTTPDNSLYGLGILSSGSSGLPSGSGTNTPGGTSTPSGAVSTTVLVPVVPLPTAEAEAQLGLAKVAEPDMDSFAAYGALVPEYCRLESMLVKGLV